MICTHDETRLVIDMPLCDSEFKNLGRFDVTMCVECQEVLSKTPTSEPPPVVTSGVALTS